VARKQDRERWTIGASAYCCKALERREYAFQKVTEAEPSYADGWLNVARALIQEGETDAKPYVEKAMAIDPQLGRIWFSKPRPSAPMAITMARSNRSKWCARISARPRGAQPDRAHPVPQTAICRRCRNSEASVRRGSETCRCITR